MFLQHPGFIFSGCGSGSGSAAAYKLLVLIFENAILLFSSMANLHSHLEYGSISFSNYQTSAWDLSVVLITAIPTGMKWQWVGFALLTVM